VIAILQQSGHELDFSHLEQMGLTSGVAGRLLLAAALGGAVGIEREWHHRASGVRTNVLICFGAALFTFLSSVIAGAGSPNRGQIASNIVQGIGFLGAGLILHNRDRVSGLTTAATVWAVASIGMCCGAGLYLPAIFATGLVLVVLEGVGVLETQANLKLYSVFYEIRGRDAQQMNLTILRAMDQEKRPFEGAEDRSIGELRRLSFHLAATRRGHRRMLEFLQAAPEVDEVHTFADVEND
jgi:putative Mg2+ transporter-C (MgtC) family protein